MDGFSDVQLKSLLNDIEDTMNFEEKVMTFGTFLHNILFNRVKGNNYTGLINSFYIRSRECGNYWRWRQISLGK